MYVKVICERPGMRQIKDVKIDLHFTDEEQPLNDSPKIK